MKCYIFCEHLNVSNLLDNNKWEITDVTFNLPDNYSFENFVHYKYLEIKDEIIYIIGMKDLKEQKLDGISFNIKKREFNLVEPKILKKLDVLKTSFEMASNIIEMNNNFFYFNCEKNEVESFSFDYLFS